MLTFLLAMCLSLFATISLGAVSDDELASAEDLAQFLTAEWVNADEVAHDIGFVDASKNPYPGHNKGEDTTIDWNSNCYLIFKDKEKTKYDMVTSDLVPVNPLGAHLSHTGPCASCSSLVDLKVYIEQRDLKTPVRNCALIPFQTQKWKCLKDIGFSDRCTWIWFWNTVNTGLSKRSGGCRGICFWHIRTPNIQPQGTHNPCRPIPEQLAAEIVEAEENDPEVPPSERILPYVDEKKGGVDEAQKKKLRLVQTPKGTGITTEKKMTGFCKNTINKGPACEEWQYMPGKHRLNPCLQCDECRSGPIFKKLAGRVRRNSGIKSAIERPGLPQIDHHYFTKKNTGIKSEL